MRVDDYLSTVGVIKRRTVAKEMGTNGLLEANGRRVKPAYDVHLGDIINIRGSHPVVIEVVAIPSGSVPKANRDQYYRRVEPTSGD